MRTSIKLLFFFLAIWFCTSTSLKSQSLQQVGSWDFHFNYRDAESLVGSPTGSLFAKESNGVYYYSSAENVLAELTLMDGLSSQDIQTIGFFGPNRILLVGHLDGSIDFVSESKVETFFGLKNNEFLTDKTLHSFSIQEENIWLGGNFGFATISITNSGFEDAFLNLGPMGQALPVLAVCSTEKHIFLATPIGLRRALRISNLKDFRNWETVSGTENSGWNQVISRDNSLLAQNNDGEIFMLNDQGIEPILGLSNTTNLKSIPEGVFFQMENGVFRIDQNGNFELISQFEEMLADFWVNTNGLQALIRNEGLLLSSTESPTRPLGPSSKTKAIGQASQEIYSLPAIVGNSTIESSPKAFASKFNQGTWVETSFPDSVTAVINFQGEVYFGTASEGVWKQFENGEAQQVNLPSSNNNLPISSLETDLLGNLWIAIADRESRLFRLNQEGVALIEVPGLQQPKKLLSDLDSRLWIVQNNSFGRTLRLFFTETGTSRSFGRAESLGALPDDQVFDILLDRQDRLWIGTKRGPAFISRASLIGPNDQVESILPRINNRPVLEGVAILALSQAPDLSFYLGTDKSGLWYFDENFSTILGNFTPENSPIPSQKINALTYDKLEGQLFVLFPQGLMSYRTGIKGALESLQKLKIFPNPVAPDFAGLLTIEGLVDGTDLLITDTRGRVVYRTFSNGGSITWNLITAGGTRLSTGVYLVYVLDSNGNQRESGKFLVI